MKFIPYRVYNGFDNMRIDSELLSEVINQKLTEPIFRLYGWSPRCISLGRNQKDDFLDYGFLGKNNIDVVRRLTGGRALLHDKEITYSYICPASILQCGDSVKESYKEISLVLIEKFAKLGINLEFGGSSGIHTKFDYCMLISTGADLTYHGKKLIGSAQFRKDGYILQHGSILYDYDKYLLEKIFNEKVDTNIITSIKEINPNITIEDIVKTFSCI